MTASNENDEQLEDIAHRLRRFTTIVSQKYGYNLTAQEQSDWTFFKEEAQKMLLGFISDGQKIS